MTARTPNMVDEVVVDMFLTGHAASVLVTRLHGPNFKHVA